ncbi:MAG: hypothetical protein AVDCRST_MAG41-818 [uncultured Corynebacteriales bacterium]|uniref:Uncharacterized protein n=1 Tax=uncultured Mycobacteriales bacterium TaxID=581187 RepID=A0A6J4HM93_9ACTN|nr:MAG: hypothetical protein AVDCRST_MAG41-818 [uncultured Corynebacteriales bacterium]
MTRTAVGSAAIDGLRIEHGRGSEVRWAGVGMTVGLCGTGGAFGWPDRLADHECP